LATHRVRFRLDADLRNPGTGPPRRIRVSGVTHLPTRAGLPVLLLTARAEDAYRLASLTVGVDDCLAKAFVPAELLVEEPPAVEHPALPATSAVGAGQLYLSERTLCRRLGELAGLTPAAWLRELRLDRAWLLFEAGGWLGDAGSRGSGLCQRPVLCAPLY
jgi:CheY-like chemotaxis protein